MERITIKDLEYQVEQLAIETGQKYALDGAYGGWKVNLMDGGCVLDTVSRGGFIGKRELFNQVKAIRQAFFINDKVAHKGHVCTKNICDHPSHVYYMEGR